jgi:hypothetical protein
MVQKVILMVFVDAMWEMKVMTFWGNVLSPSSGWLNLIQVDAWCFNTHAMMLV